MGQINGRVLKKKPRDENSTAKLYTELWLTTELRRFMYTLWCVYPHTQKITMLRRKGKAKLGELKR